MEELNKKLAEWRFGKENVKLLWGFYEYETGAFSPVPPGQGQKYDNEQAWCFLDPETEYWEPLPHLTSSLDACFKWLAPDRNITFVHFGYAADTVTCELELYSGRAFAGFADMGDNAEALALCLALEKLILVEGK